MHQSNDLLCLSHWLQAQSTCPQLSLGPLGSLRPQYLSAMAFLKAFFPFLWETCKSNQESLTSGFVLLSGWIPGLGNTERLLVNCLGDKVVFWINLYLNLHIHIFVGLKNMGHALKISVKKLWA